MKYVREGPAWHVPSLLYIYIYIFPPPRFFSTLADVFPPQLGHKVGWGGGNIKYYCSGPPPFNVCSS